MVFNHSIPNVNGNESATRETESIIVFLMAVFHTMRRKISASGLGATCGRYAALALITTLGERPGIRFGTSDIIVFIVIVCPIEIAMALCC